MRAFFSEMLSKLKLPNVRGKDGQGKSWVLSIQRSLFSRNILPSPAPRDLWRKKPLIPVDVSRYALTLPLLAETTAILSSEKSKNASVKIQRLVDDLMKSEGEYFLYDLVNVLASATRSLRMEENFSLNLEDMRSAKQSGAVVYSYSVAVLALYLAAAIKSEGFLVVWGDRLCKLIFPSDTPMLLENSRISFAMKAFGYIGMIQKLLLTSSRINEYSEDIKSSPINYVCPFSTERFFFDYGSSPLYHASGSLLSPCPDILKNHDAAVDYANRSFVSAYRTHTKIIEHISTHLPKCAASHKARNEILQNRTYSLWPGVTEIEWEEESLEAVSILSGRVDNSIETTIYCSVPDISIDAVKSECGDLKIQADMEIPSFDDDLSWEDARHNIETVDPVTGTFWDEMSVPMEAVRMCVVPKEMKIANSGKKRIPGGYVHSPRKAKSQEISVTYIPRILRSEFDGNQDQNNRSKVKNLFIPTARFRSVHQVAGHLRHLPSDKQASLNARENAKNSGLRLPENGFTFVKSHVRGSVNDGEDMKKTTRRKVRKTEREGT